ncbi:MAG: hypothetical protein V1936_01080 [Patescibacteria group bacterium]
MVERLGGDEQLEITNVASLKQQVSFYYEICRAAGHENFQAKILFNKLSSLLPLISALEGTIGPEKRLSVSNIIRQEIDKINEYIKKNLDGLPPELQSVFADPNQF